ncbi:MAG TPA: amidohydrolase family protein [Dehalococcoidia bacterium]|nr:amidohydrolase family protein [Dehalococcoidia bacterium]
MAQVREIIDGDGHIYERDDEIQPYLDSRFHYDGLRNFPFFPTLDGWHRGSFSAQFGVNPPPHPDASDWLKFLDENEISETVIYPTAGLGSGFIKDKVWYTELSRGYNNFVHDRYLKASPRLKAVALIPVVDPQAAAQELRRAVKELGMVGGLLPAIGLRRPYGDAAFDVLFKEAEDLGTMLAVHGAPQQGLGFDFFETFFPGFVLEHPLSIMIQFTSMITERVFERFPDLKVAYLEASCGWAPYLMERIDQRFKGIATKQVQNSPIYFHAELKDADVLNSVISILGDDRLTYASDYPHEQADEIAEDLEHFLAREDLSQTSKERILRDNSKALYAMR